LQAFYLKRIEVLRLFASLVGMANFRPSAVVSSAVANLIQDIRYGVRMLFKQPGFSLAAVVVLALGIGGSTAMFSVVNVLLLKPVMFKNSQEIVGCFTRDSKKADSYRAFSYPNYADLRDNNMAFSNLMAHNMALVGLADGDATKRVFVDVVSANFFSTLGVPLYRGRAFTAAEERPGSGIPVAIVSYSFWRKNGSDPEILGKTRLVNGKMLTIVGITPEGFSGTTAMISPEMYLPLGLYESVMNDFDGHGRALGARDNPALMLIGRLRPGVTAESAVPLLAVAGDRLAKSYPAENKDQVLSVHKLARLSVSTRPESDNELAFPAVLLMSMAGVVLLIASLNVANMMLVRGAARSKEIAIRQALGASRRSILQQLFTEGLVLAILGGAVGLALSYSGTNVLMGSLARLAPLDLLYDGAPDSRVLMATIGFCALSALLFSLGPARTFSKIGIVTAIKSGENPETQAGHSRSLFSRRNLLVMGQIALSMMLLTSAGLFIRSSFVSANVQPGFNMNNGVLLETDPSLAGYDEARGRRMYATLMERLRGIPGVESVSMGATVPFGMVSFDRGVQVGGAAPLSFRYNVIGEDYFKTLDIPLLKGRTFNHAETGGGKTPAVVILDRLAVKKLWPNVGPNGDAASDAVGKHVQLLARSGASGTQDAEVIGVVGSIQENLFGQGLDPHVYVPYGLDYMSGMNVHMKIAGDPAGVLEAARREIQAVDNRLPVLSLRTLRGHLDASVDLWMVGTAARMFSVFGAVALLLAMVGLYSIRAYTATRRTREIGIRLALGAKPSDARQLILREGLMLTAIGAATGLGLSLVAGRLLTSVLYKVSGTDALVLFSSAAILGGVSLLACYFPALRASRVDPMVALRHD
jgi:predicted permease